MNYMQHALELAKSGLGRTSPNPAVGCVIVKNGKIVGEGYHKKAGTDHAEIVALKMAGLNAKGASMYVTLEPCCCYGRTPPCTDAIINAGIKEVIIGIVDPNPKVCGKGVAFLRKNRTIVKYLKNEKLKKQIKKINLPFIKHITTGKPFVLLKVATSLDGRISGANGYITNEDSRKFVHELRNIYDAVLVSSNTVIKDNPLLTCRIKDGRDPVRIIVDSEFRTSLKSNVYKDSNVIVVTTINADKGKIRKLKLIGGRVIIVNDKKGLVDLGGMLLKLGSIGITSVMVEGGSKISAAFINEKVVDKIMFFIAPKLMKGSVIADIDKLLELKEVNIRKFGSDVMVEGYVK